MVKRNNAAGLLGDNERFARRPLLHEMLTDRPDHSCDHAVTFDLVSGSPQPAGIGLDAVLQRRSNVGRRISGLPYMRKMYAAGQRNIIEEMPDPLTWQPSLSLAG
ncbi:hypothetical protein TraAM80_02838 [Trypanosoma rangeli]|uniref:Uncharacterized protein n=1 Tax=Trypanosoma rangeli TaxID=5698 RepID=A0A422NSD4_TRYRA|nr:uncharacterized protein TraAM80_02838 [Trypanosoma rangeli]RNF08378.1 hypothetical protein TraAM80_02838 [Trypanosoma rangeli]|eukprot:RNF08378.1 hypothetical protein TraAM80_02838 [Trypanosoma rangeli]